MGGAAIVELVIQRRIIVEEPEVWELRCDVCGEITHTTCASVPHVFRWRTLQQTGTCPRCNPRTCLCAKNRGQGIPSAVWGSGGKRGLHCNLACWTNRSPDAPTQLRF